MTKEIEELLPFYVNGSLAEEERRAVEKALAENPDLENEYNFLVSLREEYRGLDTENSPGELGLKRLQRDLSKEKKLEATGQEATVVTYGNKYWRFAAVAACILLLVQTVYVLPQWQQSDDLVSASGSQVSPVRGPILFVTFVPEAQEENIRELLLSVDARIVDGPSALGVYKVSVSKNPDDVISKLLAHKNLIETAQRVGGE